jgi:hypothetical protein
MCAWQEICLVTLIKISATLVGSKSYARSCGTSRYAERYRITKQTAPKYDASIMQKTIISTHHNDLFRRFHMQLACTRSCNSKGPFNYIVLPKHVLVGESNLNNKLTLSALPACGILHNEVLANADICGSNLTQRSCTRFSKDVQGQAMNKKKGSHLPWFLALQNGWRSCK